MSFILVLSPFIISYLYRESCIVRISGILFNVAGLSNQINDSITKEEELLPMQFNTIGISDGISMGTDGMSYSLPSRDLISDSIVLP